MPWTTPVTESQIVAIHAALLPTEPDGAIVYFGDWSGGGGGVGVQEVTHTRLHHLQPGHPDPVEAMSGQDVLPTTDVFCAGQSFMADGRLLAAGGTLGWAGGHEGIHEPHYDGERACWVFLPHAKRWVRVADLNFQPGSNSVGGGRWYPTLITVENGDVFAVGGHPTADDSYPTNVGDAAKRHNNNTPERYSPGADTWHLMNGLTAPDGFAYETDGYPRFHLMPSGLLFSDTAGNDSGNGDLSRKRLYDPFNGTWTGPDVGGLGTLPGRYDRGSECTSVLLPLLPPHYGARVLACNSDDDTAFRIDVDDSPAWVTTVPRSGSAAGRWRANACATLLPTGQVVVTGGWPGNASADDPAAATREPELYTPGIDWDAGDFSDTSEESWATLDDPAPNRRGYHSTALLMPDGRVWHGGSTTTSEPLNREIDLFEPDYVGAAGRPVITAAPDSISYNTAFEIGTPQSNSIERVALIRCGSITHGFNSDQRYVGLSFSVVDGNSLSVAPPPNGRVAPPGQYMLWIVDDEGRPCERAAFVRVCRQKLIISADVSTFSVHEVEALGTPAAFSQALNIVADGFLPSEVSPPTWDLLYTNNEPVPGVTISLGSPKYEAGSTQADTAQRIAYPVTVTFTSMAAFDDIPAADDSRPIVLYARMGPHVGFVNLYLSKNPNPRMSDGEPHYLSVDLRVFTTSPGDTFTAGVAHPAEGADGAYGYVQALLQAYNDWDDPGHPFDDLPTDLAANRLELASHHPSGDPAYNYALARVRFRAPEGVDAADVRVFFRMWTTGWNALEYRLDGSYRRMGNGPSATPLLGIEGGEINNVPCFAQPRTADMENQADQQNRRTMQGVGATEVHAYFGCWLDVNQDVARFPLSPTHNGPFDDGDDPDGLKSIQELMRGLHQCLVAEVHYDLDPTPPGATPGSSDNLAQRNILFDDSDNPGSLAAHLVHHTYELEPSPTSFDQWALTTQVGAIAGSTRIHPDELVLDWGNLPRDSIVTLFMPQLEAAEIVRGNAIRQGPNHVHVVDDHTIRCLVTDVGYVPIPGPLDQSIAGLLSVQLPPGVAAGSTYTVTMRQVDGRTFKVLGTTEFRIGVGHAADLLPHKLHDLSVLRHIDLAIPSDNRWKPVFERYLSELEERIRAFGGDPDSAEPSPTGHPGGRPGDGQPDGPGPAERCVSGRVCRVLYDCVGDFKGFVLRDCDGERPIPTCDIGIERVVLNALERRLVVAIAMSNGRVAHLTVGACGCDACDPADGSRKAAEPTPQIIAQRTPASRPDIRRRDVRPGAHDPRHGSDDAGESPDQRHEH